MNRYRTHNCYNLRKSDENSLVRLSGWIHCIRNHGKIFFIDLRDHYGIIQIVSDYTLSSFEKIINLRNEWVICIDGYVKLRTKDTINSNLPNGDIEILAKDIEVLSKAKELPFSISEKKNYPENIRLKYRFLDLRREKMHKNIMRRSEIIFKMREKMHKEGFTEFSTPILTASSPEGARDFLVPSRIHKGKFYALPQAPQQYKQILMISGFDRYFQIAPCFRDEDPRSDRLIGEFYQLDIEMSFIEQEDIFCLTESVVREIFEEFSEGKRVTNIFPRISYEDSIQKYGTDKPDLRNPIVIQNVSKYFSGSNFRIFSNLLKKDSSIEVWAIPAKTGGNKSFCEKINNWAKKEEKKPLSYIFWKNKNNILESFGSISKILEHDRKESIRNQLSLSNNDACFFIAGNPKDIAGFASSVRMKVGEELDVIDHDCFKLAWIINFPLYKWNDKDKKIEFFHNPFSSPQGGISSLMRDDPIKIQAYQYDIVCNGYEIASGGIRNHSLEIMIKSFEIAGFSKETIKKRFGGLYLALQYGVPPHGGIAAGIDRIIMLLTGEINLREITAFPMNQKGLDLLMRSPSHVELEQLQDLNLQIKSLTNDQLNRNQSKM